MGKSGKTRNAAKKRFKVTGTGKITRRRARGAHLLTKMSRKQKRRTKGDEVCSPADETVLRKMIQGG